MLGLDHAGREGDGEAWQQQQQGRHSGDREEARLTGQVTNLSYNLS